MKVYRIYYKNIRYWQGDGRFLNTSDGETEYLEADTRDKLVENIDEFIKNFALSLLREIEKEFGRHWMKDRTSVDISIFERDEIRFLSPIVEFDDEETSDPDFYNEVFQQQAKTLVDESFQKHKKKDEERTQREFERKAALEELKKEQDYQEYLRLKEKFE